MKNTPFLLIGGMILSLIACGPKEESTATQPKTLSTNLAIEEGSLDSVVGTVAQFIYDQAARDPNLTEISVTVTLNRDFLAERLKRDIPEDPVLCTITEKDLEAVRGYEMRWNYLHDSDARVRYKAEVEEQGDPEILQVLRDYPKELIENAGGLTRTEFEAKPDESRPEGE